MRPDRERFGRRCDAVVSGVVAALLAFAPLAFGAVHPWSLAIVQILVAGLVFAWAAKLLVCGQTTEGTERLRGWCAPLLVFGGLVVLQLIPLPSPALRVLSPSTAAIYRGNLPGWPESEPYEGVVATARTLELDPATDHDPLVKQIQALATQLPRFTNWRSLSVYRYGTGEELLVMLTWSTVFFCSLATLGIGRSTHRAGHPIPHPTRPPMMASASNSVCGWRWSPPSV